MRQILPWALLALVLLLAAAWALRGGSILPSPAPDRPEVKHAVVLERIEKLGRLELLRYQFKDVVDYKLVKDWLPELLDPRVLLIVEGEAVGCIDFQRMDSSAIRLGADTLWVALPAPEICFYKIDMEKSRVYDTHLITLYQDPSIIDSAYRAAERQILSTARQSDLLEKAKTQALNLLEPMLEAMSGKAVVLSFELNSGQSVR